MHLFNDYIQPLTFWLHNHPKWALLITFFIAFAESLAIVGSIVPGSVTMTAVGILAGSGIMRIDLTLLAATLGAVIGDGTSYFLGYFFSDHLTTIWPFKRYPNWLNYGKAYFARHGGKSVIIGRFVGPLRSIIPVIAGMMHMNQWRFFMANFVSAVGWSILYVLPGILIGAASNELSPEIATRLFTIVLFLLVGLWLLTLVLKWLFIKVNRLFRLYSQYFWLWAKDNRYFGKIARLLTPKNESLHYSTATLFILFMLSTLLFCLLAILALNDSLLAEINRPIFLLLQSLRTHSFDIFFTVVTQISSPLTLLTLLLSVVFLALYYSDYRTLAYWLSLSAWSVLIILIMHRLSAFLGHSHHLFPNARFSFATTLFFTFILYLNAYCQVRYKHLLVSLLITSLLLLGCASVYFGDDWLTDCLGAYLCGLSISLGHWLFYRRYQPRIANHPYLPLLILLLLILATTVSSFMNYQTLMRKHQPTFAQYVVNDALWWNQTKPLLPLYRTNRLGHHVSLFNIQYAGSIDELEKALTAYGWQKQSNSLINSIITRVSKQPSAPELPLMAQLYLNNKPILVMTYEPTDDNPVQVVRIWRSNYHLQHFHQPIWLGSVHPRNLHKAKKTKKIRKHKNPPKSLVYVSSALSSFTLRKVVLPLEVSTQPLATEVEPFLLLIKEP